MLHRAFGLATVALLASVCFAPPRSVAEDPPVDERTQQPQVMPHRESAAATSDRDHFQLLPGFQVELLYTVPKGEQCSWVSLAVDPQGRLIASDEGGQGMYRITPPAIGSAEPTRVAKLDIDLGSAQGLLYAFDSLYVGVNGGNKSGLYRARDTDGDDQFDKVDKLKSFVEGGEHGVHAIRLGPQGKSLYFVAGNHTDPPEELAGSRITTNWGEDLLLPQQWDAGGHAVGRMAPGGWIAKVDPDGKRWEMISIGYRNAYDIDFNDDGELFAYDADMESDMGTPWYRPTRVVHATSGSDFGWRSGSAKWPTYYADSLPELVDTEPQALALAAVALARQADPSLLPEVVDRLRTIDLAAVDEPVLLDVLRAYALALIRLRSPDDHTKTHRLYEFRADWPNLTRLAPADRRIARRVVQHLDPHFPAKSPAVNQELRRLLIYLESPKVITEALSVWDAPVEQSPQDLAGLLSRNGGYGEPIAKILANHPEVQKLHYAFVLRNLRYGWTLDQRKAYFAWLVEPSRAVSDQYQTTTILTDAGRTVSGRVVGRNGGVVTVQTDAYDPHKTERLPEAEIDEIEQNRVSLMPAGLLDALNADEVSDLLAHLLSRGNPDDPMFAP